MLTERAAKVFEQLGCKLTTVEKVFDADPLPIFMAEFFAGVGTKLRPFLEDSRELLDPAVALMLEDALGQDMGAYYTPVFQSYALRTKVA